MIGRNVCYHHGGRTLQGMASGTFKDGRHSKFLPPRLKETYQAARADDRLLELRDDISLLDARLTDVLKRVETGESGQLWVMIRQVWGDFTVAKLASKIPEMQEHLAILGDLIERGLADYAAWGEVRGLLEQRRKLVESERKRLVELQQVITTEQAMVLVSLLIDTVRKHVTDRDALAGISGDLARVLNVQARVGDSPAR